MSLQTSPADVMSESEFLIRADAILAQIERLAEDGAQDIDAQRRGNVLELEWPDAQKLIVTLQTPMREIWLAARAGGFHYRCVDSVWRDTRSGEELFAMLRQFFNT